MNFKSEPIDPVVGMPVFDFFPRILEPGIVMGAFHLMYAVAGTPMTGTDVMFAVIAFLVCAMFFGWSEHRRLLRNGYFIRSMYALLHTWFRVLAVMLPIGYFIGVANAFSPLMLSAWLFATPIALLLCEGMLQKIARDFLNPQLAKPVVIVGANPQGVTLAERIGQSPELHMNLCGFFDDRTITRHAMRGGTPILGAIADLPDYVRRHRIHAIFISQPISAQPRIRSLLDGLQDTTASVYFLPDIYGLDLIQARFDWIGGVPVVAICDTPFTGMNHAVKRGSDIVLALILLLFLAPLMALIALSIKLSSSGPIIFRQRRYGLDGDEIVIYKFRSMTVCEDGTTITQAARNDSRVTRLGSLLRRTSLDELPQFLNVLQGRMSIVGPRPHAVAHNEKYRKQIKGYMRRHKVRPGITGWAQVNGMRGETETLDKMEARIAYDLDYLRRWSLMLDLWIIARTVKVAFFRNNAY